MTIHTIKYINRVFSMLETKRTGNPAQGPASGKHAFKNFTIQTHPKTACERKARFTCAQTAGHKPGGRKYR